MHGARPFHLLRDLPEAPQLPFSYPVRWGLGLLAQGLPLADCFAGTPTQGVVGWLALPWPATRPLPSPAAACRPCRWP